MKKKSKVQKASKKANHYFTMCLSPELYEQTVQHCESHGKNKTALLRSLLKKFLNPDNDVKKWKEVNG